MKQIGGKKTKYNAQKVINNGIKFDSKLEARFYNYLIENNWNILELQPSFVLQPSFIHNTKTIHPITYRADFKIEKDGDVYILDAKGMETAEFKLKKKMFLYKYGSEHRLIVAQSFKQFNELINLN